MPGPAGRPLDAFRASDMLPATHPVPPPLPRTEWQRRRFEQVSDAARLASERARPDLLAALNDRTFRERLSKHCAPLAANSSASDLLRRLRAEYSVAEVVSSFDAESPRGGIFRKPFWWSFTLSDGMAGDEMLNEWEVRVKHNESFDGGKGWFGKQDDVETKLYGLRPFASHGSPRSESEAAERSMCAAPASSTHAPRTLTTPPFLRGWASAPPCECTRETAWQIRAPQPRGRGRRQSAVRRHLCCALAAPRPRRDASERH